MTFWSSGVATATLRNRRTFSAGLIRCLRSADIPGCGRIFVQKTFAFETPESGSPRIASGWKIDLDRRSPGSLAQTSLFPNEEIHPSGPWIGPSAAQPAPLLIAFPCNFPTDQGFAPRDEFAPDCPHRHLVWACRDFPTALRHSPRNPRDSARLGR